ncbi:MAG: DUF3772 domain-containing protein, partial [Hyphomicrobiaceae bacterium]|nr:DUF3772 domain-containing protein [Hyphomicrobiaceae bacterium]
MSSRGPIAAYRRLLAILVAVLLGCLATSHAAIAQTAAKPATQPPAPVVTPAPDVTPTPTAPPLSAPTAAPPPAAAREPAKPAQPRLARAIADPLKKLSEDVDSVSGRVEDAAENEDELNTLRSKLDELLAVAKELEQKIKAPLADVKSQIDKLGPAPGKDAAPESPQVAAERKRLGVYFSQLDGAAKTVKLAEEQIGQLVGRIQELRRALFTQALLKRTRSPLRPAVWSDMIEHSGTTMRLIGIVLKAWWLEIQPHLIEVILLLVASLLTLFGLKRLVKRLIRWVRGGDQPRERTQLA